MAWPMIEWVLDQRYGHLHQKSAHTEKSVIVMGSMEATLTPLMLVIEAAHAGIKVFSLPSVDHPQYGRHIELESDYYEHIELPGMVREVHFNPHSEGIF